jgi:chaperone BCS1
MSNLSRVLRSAGFSKVFCRSLDQRDDILGEDGSKQKGYMVIIDEANLLRFVLEDFTAHGDNIQTLAYTNLSLESLREEDALKEPGDRKICTVGPGVHKHQTEDVLFCYENADIAPLMTSGVHKFVNRAAIVSLTSLQTIKDYLAKIYRKNEEEKKLKLYVCNDMQWEQQKVTLRKADTLFVGKVWKEIYAESKEFFSDECREFYLRHGIPYVRTYMFYGDPGNGKSSCIKTLASEMGVDLYSLNLTMARMDDMSLTSMVNEIDKGSIVAIEDVDRIFDNFSVNQTASSVSFSTLLNIMDGTVTKEGIIIILTCNNYDQLDDALKRCGRIDRTYKFPNASGRVMERMFLSFYPEKKAEAKNFVSQIKTISDIPVCTVQEFFVRNRKRSAEEAVKDVDTSFFKRRRKQDRNMVI